jgi:hypothetical protein
MRLTCFIIAALLCLLVPTRGLAQQRPLADAVRAGLATPAGPPLRADPPPASPGGDSVLDGVLIGAAIGGGVGLVSVLAVCSGDYRGACDDEPGSGPLAATTALIGAGAGALLGWLFDHHRSSGPSADRKSARPSGPALAVAPVALPSRKVLQLTLRY